MAEQRARILGRCKLISLIQEQIDELCARIAADGALPRAIRDDMASGPQSGSISAAATSSGSEASGTTSLSSPGAGSRTTCARLCDLNPDGLGAGAADVVGRCLLDSAADEVFMLQQIRVHDPAEVYGEVKRALGNIAVRSRHVGTELSRVAKTVEKA